MRSMTVQADRLQSALSEPALARRRREARRLSSIKLMSKTPIISGLKIKGAVWCQPDIRAEIEYRDVTRDGLLRHASLKIY
jgi:ATP-dependent DNA ligase